MYGREGQGSEILLIIPWSDRQKLVAKSQACASAACNPVGSPRAQNPTQKLLRAHNCVFQSITVWLQPQDDHCNGLIFFEAIIKETNSLRLLSPTEILLPPLLQWQLRCHPGHTAGSPHDHDH